MQPISPAHARLGQALRAARISGGISTRRVVRSHPNHAYFSSGHISLVEHGRTTPSPELIEAYTDFAPDRAVILALYEQMLAESQRLNREKRGVPPSGPKPPRLLEDVRTRRDVQAHYTVESNEAHYIFGPAGQLDQVHCTVLLRALEPDVTMYYAGHTYSADQRPGVLSVEVVSGGDLAGTQESASGALRSFFSLDRALSPDDPEAHAASFRLRVNSLARCVPRLIYQAAVGNHRMVLKASFAPTMGPDHIWRFGAPDLIDAEYAEYGVRLPMNQAGVYRYRFEQLVPGWCYGFAWSWTDHDA